MAQRAGQKVLGLAEAGVTQLQDNFSLDPLGLGQEIAFTNLIDTMKPLVNGAKRVFQASVIQLPTCQFDEEGRAHQCLTLRFQSAEAPLQERHALTGPLLANEQCTLPRYCRRFEMGEQVLLRNALQALDHLRSKRQLAHPNGYRNVAREGHAERYRMIQLLRLQYRLLDCYK